MCILYTIYVSKKVQLFKLNALTCIQFEIIMQLASEMIYIFVYIFDIRNNSFLNKINPKV